MKLKELYSVVCIIFASNFKGVIDKEHFDKLAKNWVVVNQNPQNKTGHEFWAKFLENRDKNSDETLKKIGADFELLKPSFDIDTFKLISETDITLFFEKFRYKRPFANLKACHAANMLAFLAAVLKHDNDEKTHNLLGLYLTKFYMPSFRALANTLQTEAKSDYYKAFGWFLSDFNKMIKDSLGLKI